MDEHNSLTREEHFQPFGNYDLMRRIDMGGMGEVYLARQRSAFQREVAIKIIRDDVSRDPLARARFFREAEVSSYLKHDHILPLFEFGEVQGRLFLVTPYISGGTLAQRLLAGPLPMPEVQQCFSALVQAVAYIHRQGIVHRDLKPSNILLDDEEASGQVYVRLIDFGIATKQGAAASPPLTPAGQELGTIGYMAPERLNGIAAPSNDIYSLGVILHQMLTRRFPAKEIFRSDALPAPLEDVIRRCTAANPAERYASAAELLSAFEQSCQTLQAPHAAQPAVFHASSSVSPQTIEHTTGVIGAVPHPQSVAGDPFGEADYAAATMEFAYARKGRKVGRGSVKKQGRRKPLLLLASLSTVVVLFVMAGIVFFAFPLVASAKVNIGPQVQTLQQVYTITARPALTSIDVASASLPAREEVETATGSLTGQTTGQQCRFLFFQCQQGVASTDVENLLSQLRQSLIAQLSTTMDDQLQTLHAIGVESKHFTDLSRASNPDNGATSRTVTVTLTEQGSVEYVENAEVQQLTRLLLMQKLGPNTGLVDTTIQIGQPVVEAVTDLGTVTMKIAAAGVGEYHYPPAQVEAILNHIKGMALADARAYLQQQPGVDANSVSISVQTPFGMSNTLPDSPSQITIISINPATLPAAALPVVATPADTSGGLTPTVQ